MKYFIPLFVSFFYQLSFSQTCVIAKKTKDAIYVGADSRHSLTKVDNSGVEKTDTSSSCKIYNIGNFNFAIIGSFSEYVIPLMKKACREKQTFQKIARTYIDSIGKIIVDFYLKKVKKTEWVSFEKKHPFPSIVLFGTQGDSLFLSLTGFIMRNDNSIDYKSKELNLIYDGQIEAIEDTIKKKNTWLAGEVSTIRNLIGIEAKAVPLKVGGAIDIIKVTKNSTIWISKKEMCE